ncbi:hypothetical protein VTN77DRAFT_7093 [Rasamsonia byssochlamydoides]|uniref:uncharacterized protein n=1 Tax=Rasamsonia byssochlamydoides TaxID=89139 RepID=UPI0037430A1F
MRSLWITPVLLSLGLVAEATVTTTDGTESLMTLQGTKDPFSLEGFATGTYESVTTTITVSASGLDGLTTTAATASEMGTASGTGNITEPAAVRTTTSASVTLLVGGQGTTSLAPNGTANGTMVATSTTSPSALPTNTQPCNGYVEFCSRNYSNITVVAAHNSPFVRAGSFAANQQYPVTTQLNDGIRMLQFQTHYLNGTMYLCHTSCDLLNAGTLEAYLTTVVQWLQQNPYEVITILMGNYDLVAPTNFTAPIINSGLINYAYTPPKIPMALDDWPPLSSFILTGKRAVIFMDYQANQTEVPYILDEFSQMWETPFSPTDRNFPCTVQRPPNLADSDARNRLYLANHNLNLEIQLAGLDILVPNTALLNVTNAVSGYGSLGWMADNCTTQWGRPPNFLLVDYYNDGNVNGSVFEVAAMMNNVTYNGHCCGTQTSTACGLSSSMGPMNVVWVTILVSIVWSVLGA